jgi:hypothetical protein
VFRSAGLTVQRSFSGWDTFPPLLVIEVRKPQDAEAKAEETAR